MTEIEIIDLIKKLADQYNKPDLFLNDPILFPKYFFEEYGRGNALLQDIEIAGILASHLAWGRREMIVRDCKRMFEQMNWRPYEYIMTYSYKNDNTSLHRTIKWSEFAKICNNLYSFYKSNKTLETMSPQELRSNIFGQKIDKNAANKKIHMFRRWMVRDDGLVDLGIWKNIDKNSLIIPLDVHVHRTALDLGITVRKSADYKTALEITNFLKLVFPFDPCKGDFALFAVAATKSQKKD